MTIRVTGRSDTTHPLVQQQPLDQSLYVPPQGPMQGRRGTHTSTPQTVHSQPPDIAVEQTANIPASQDAPPVQPTPARNVSWTQPLENGVLWIIGAGILFMLMSVLILSFSERWTTIGLPTWRPQSQQSNTAVLTDTVQSMLAPLDQATVSNRAAIGELNDKMASLQATLLARPAAPAWRWHAAPTPPDNPMLFITLEMHGVPIEEISALVRLSNGRTGQSLLVELKSLDGLYRGIFKGFRDSMPIRSDMLSVQVNDPIYVEWLTDSPIAPGLLVVDNAILRQDSGPEIDLSPNADAAGPSDEETGNDAREMP